MGARADADFKLRYSFNSRRRSAAKYEVPLLPEFRVYGKVKPFLAGVTLSTHFWLPTVAFMILPAVWAVGRVVRCRYPADDQCTSCGYNLTGTLAAGHGECPECGTQVVAASTKESMAEKREPAKEES